MIVRIRNISYLSIVWLGLMSVVVQPCVAQGLSDVTNSPSVSYGPLWKTSSGYSTALTVRNSGAQNTTANVHLYSSGGQETGATTLSLPHGRTVRLNLSKSIPAAASGEGGLSVEWAGGSQGVSARVELSEPKGSIVNYQLQGGYAYDTESSLSAPWWLPDAETDGSLTLFNTSTQDITVTPSISAAGVKKSLTQVSVPPNATQELQLRTLLASAGIKDANAGAITLHYSGAPHALQPALLLSNSNTGFSFLSKFDATHAARSQQQTNWQFPTVALAVENRPNAGQVSDPLTSYMLLSNTTQSQLAPQMTAFAVSGGEEKRTTLSLTPLMPYETRLVNLSQQSGSLPTGISRMGLTVSHPGEPGDLGITIFSVDNGNQVISESAGDLLDATALSTSYWDISSGRIQFQHITSSSGSTQPVTVTVYYQAQGGTGSYTLPGSFSVEDNQDKVINIAQITRLQAPDTIGRTLPSGVKSGFVSLRTAGVAASSALAQTSDTCLTACLTQTSIAANSLSIPSSLSGLDTQMAIKSIGPRPACTSPTQPPPPVQPTCGGVIYYRPVSGSLGYIANHSFWYIQDSVGNELVIDGGPSIPRCFNDPNCFLIDWTYLAPAGHYPEDNIYTASAWESTPTNVDVCPNMDALESYAQLWPPGGTPVPYSGTGLAGQNSNTFAHDCATAAGITADRPPAAVGW